MRYSHRIVVGILFLLGLNHPAFLQAEPLNENNVRSEIVRGLSQVKPKQRIPLFKVVGYDAGPLTKEEWRSLHWLLEETAKACADEPYTSEFVRVWAPEIALLQCSKLKDVGERDWAYSRLTRFKDGVVTSEQAKRVAELAFQRIENPAVRHHVSWNLAASSKGTSFEKVKTLCAKLESGTEEFEIDRATNGQFAAVLARFASARTVKVVELITDEIGLKGDAAINAITAITAKAKDKLNDEQLAILLSAAADELSASAYAEYQLRVILPDLERLRPMRAKELLERYRADKAETAKELLRRLGEDDELARKQLSFYGGFPLYHEISDRQLPLAQAQRYVDALLQIAEGLGDEDCTRNTFLLFLTIDREGIRVPGSNDFLASLDVEKVGESQIGNVIHLFEHEKQRQILRLAFPKKVALKQFGQERWFVYGQGKRHIVPWKHVSVQIAGRLASKSTIPEQQKRKYFQRLIKECATPAEQFGLARFIAKFDVNWALEILWDVRGELKGERSGCGVSSGYGVTLWPKNNVGWLRELFARYDATEYQSTFSNYPLIEDAALIKGINHFLKQIADVDDREALLLYRCYAEGRLGDVEIANATANQITIPAYRVRAFSSILRHLKKQKM